MKKMICRVIFLLVFVVNIYSQGVAPTLSNFRIENSKKDRVYFDVKGDISSLTTNGFVISGKTITAVNTTSNYFTVSSAFTYWDFALLIKQHGGDGIVYDFSWEEVVNNILEPVNSTIRYVEVGASGSGHSIDDPMSYTSAQSVSAGTTVYWKSGNYGSITFAGSNAGTAANPIKHIGYKNTPGDATQLTRSVGMSFDSAEMPLFNGTGSGWGFTTKGAYNIVRNFQVDNYSHCFNEASQDPDFTIFDNVYGSNADFGLYVNNLGSTGTKVINSYFADMASISVRVYNTNNVIKNTWAVTSKVSNNDYYLSLYGSTVSEFNIIKGNYVNRFATDSHTGHGVSLKSGQPEYQIENTLVEDNTILNVGQSLEPRHRGTRYNVFRGNHVEKTNTVTNINGVSFHDGGSFNLFENNLFKNIETGIRWYETTEDDEIGKENAHNVIFKNNVFDGCNSIFDEAIMAGATSPSLIYNNTFIHNTFNDIAYVWSGNDSVDFDSTNLFTNNIFNDVRKLGSYTNFDTSFNYNLFYVSWVNSLGTNSINIDPQLDASFVPQAIFTDIDVPPVLGVYYDIDEEERSTTPDNTTVGAVAIEVAALDIVAPVNTTVGSVTANAGSDALICSGESVTLTASGGSDYSWSTGATTKSITVNPNTTTTYSVTVSEGSVSDIDEVLVTVTSLTANAGSDATINEGESITLTASGGDSYKWSNGETTARISVSPSTTTTYSVTATKNGCEDTDSVKVTVNATSVSVTANAGSDTSICLGESVILTASGGSSYKWSTGATTKSITVNPTETITYTVTASVGSSSDTDEVVVKVNSVTANAGSDVTINEGESITLTASGGDSYKWSNGETTASISVSPSATTTYFVIATKNGCEDTSSVKVTVNSQVSDPIQVVEDFSEDLSLEEEPKSLEIQVYPNPTTGILKLESNNTHPDLNIHLINSNGQILYQGKTNSEKTRFSKELDLSSYTKGIYFVIFISSTQNEAKKVVLI